MLRRVFLFLYRCWDSDAFLIILFARVVLCSFCTGVNTALFRIIRPLGLHFIKQSVLVSVGTEWYVLVYVLDHPGVRVVLCFLYWWTRMRLRILLHVLRCVFFLGVVLGPFGDLGVCAGVHVSGRPWAICCRANQKTEVLRQIRKNAHKCFT